MEGPNRDLYRNSGERQKEYDDTRPFLTQTRCVQCTGQATVRSIAQFGKVQRSGPKSDREEGDQHRDAADHRIKEKLEGGFRTAGSTIKFYEEKSRDQA